MNLVERLRTYQENISGDMIPIYETPDVCIEAADRIEELEKDASKQCVWELDNTDCFYHTGCDNSFVLNDGTPADNNMKFCPYCAGSIKESENLPWEDNSPVPDWSQHGFVEEKR